MSLQTIETFQINSELALTVIDDAEDGVTFQLTQESDNGDQFDGVEGDQFDGVEINDVTLDEQEAHKLVEVFTRFLKKPKKMYVLNMAGDGDIDIRIVDQETWDWLDSPDPNTPKNILERECFWRDSMDQTQNLKATTHPDTNDRALSAPPCQHPNGTWMYFVYLKDYVKFLQDHPDIKITEELQGTIY